MLLITIASFSLVVSMANCRRAILTPVPNYDSGYSSTQLRIEKIISKNHKSYTKMFSEASQERKQTLKRVNGSGWTTSNLHSPELGTYFMIPEAILKEFVSSLFIFDTILGFASFENSCSEPHLLQH